MQKISILIPLYNEENTIIEILNKIIKVVFQENITKEIIVVDDCSLDQSYESVEIFAKQNPHISLFLFKHNVNKGKGAAIKTGIANATGNYIIIQDADLEYNPNEYNILLQPILDGYADVVYGSRFMGGKPHRILFFWHTIGNKFLTFLSNMTTNLNLTDMESCYKLFKTDILKSIVLKENRFGFEPEVTAKIARIPNVRIYEVGISYFGRTYKEGKKINWKDGIHAIYCIIKYGFLRF